jgi:hypothetical protein
MRRVVRYGSVPESPSGKHRHGVQFMSRVVDAELFEAATFNPVTD